ISDNEYLFYIDKLTQRNFLIHHSSGGKIEIIGYDKISTGNPKRGKKYFETPDLIINRVKGTKPIYKGDWSAEGTDSKGYIINKDGKKIPAYVNFHFAMHKTTPRATTQLGRKLSHGCIRMTPFTVDLLDKQKILDGKKGKYIIVGDYR
ncbi:MAG: hypothetical protein QM490_05650, partial [Candidatus Gracilibacteria bacterium]